ncbi:hypothetical protein HanPI659440_Chr04g0175171 [Helianthus annuus]|nr:hypothetical protein HanPI659440_Chr04g0175171 [Helianthus annuus]
MAANATKRLTGNQRLKQLRWRRNLHCHHPFQHLHHHPHCWSSHLFILYTPHRHQPDSHHLLHVILAAKPLIHNSRHIPLRYPPRRPRWEKPLFVTLTSVTTIRRPLYVPPTP